MPARVLIERSQIYNQQIALGKVDKDVPVF